MTRAALLAVTIAACSRGGAPATPAPPPARVVGADAGDRLRDADGLVRPEAAAGIYWIPYATCDECARPAALVAYLFDDVGPARAAVRALEGRLRLGLPYVVHTEPLMAGPGRIAVVVGAFGTMADASAAAAGSEPIGGAVATLIPIDEYWPSEEPHQVTAIDRGGPVAAWSADDLRAADEAAGARLEAEDLEARADDPFERELAKRTPACTVQPGDLFVVEEAQFDWYRFAPVWCGATLAYVPWTSTLLGHAVVLPDGRGGHVLRQIVGAECDSPIIREWRYDEHGRRAREPEGGGDDQLALGGC